MKNKICVVGLGYVGLPLAVELSKHFEVIGFDINEVKILELSKGIDMMGELSEKDLTSSKIEFSSNEKVISKSDFLIICVPTPISKDFEPDLSFVKSASETVGRNLKQNSVVVFESTVYPGVTEEICVPILEQESGLKYKHDFTVGYSPERINPGDQEHTVDKIVKVISGTNEKTVEILENVYGKITKIYSAESIKVAEAAKAIENAQRDLNIAFMNELKILFDKTNINMDAVLRAAETKWNFIKFRPGMVGGHCIPVDPHYLTYLAKKNGIDTEMILAGRNINDNMYKFYATKICDRFKEDELILFGLTFKPNVSDFRNSQVFNLISELKLRGKKIRCYDPFMADEGYEKYNLEKISLKEALNLGKKIIIAVDHDEFINIDFEKVIRLNEL